MKWKTKAAIALAIGVSYNGSGAAANDPGAYEVPVGEMVGVNHVGGRYHFTEKPFLEEGADRMLELGSRTIKLWLNRYPANNYPFNSDWKAHLAGVESVADLARTPFYRTVFDMPLKTFF